MTYVLAKPSVLLQELDGYPQHSVEKNYAGKRLFDLVIVLAALPFLMALIGILACFVALDGANPFFLQRRVGKDGSVFHMFKLRTMVPDAEARLKAYLAADASARAEWDQYQKLTHDPRITWLGRLLRKTSLDELPQFFNVLTGDMSLVGPRPIMVDQAEMYPGRAYYRMRPGITGPWQVSDRNKVTFADRATFDLQYLRTQSLLSDLKYLALTFGAVCRMSGR